MRQKYYGVLYVYVCIISTSFVSAANDSSNQTANNIKPCSHGYKIEDGKCINISEIKNENELKWKVAALTILGIFITAAVIVFAKYYRTRCKKLTESVTSPIYESLQRRCTRTSTNCLHQQNPSNAQRQEHQQHFDVQNCHDMFITNKNKCYKTQYNSKHSQKMLKTTGTSNSNIYEAIWGKECHSDKTNDKLLYMEMKFTPKDNKTIGPNYKDNSQKEQFKEGTYEAPWNQSVKLVIPKCGADEAKMKRSNEVTYEDPWEQEFTLPTKRHIEYSSTSKKKTKQNDDQVYEEAWGKGSLSSILSSNDETSKISTIHSRTISHENSKKKTKQKDDQIYNEAWGKENLSSVFSAKDETSKTSTIHSRTIAHENSKKKTKQKDDQIYEEAWGKESLSSILSAKDETGKTSTTHSRKIAHENSFGRKLLPRILNKTIKTLPRDNISMMPSTLHKVSNIRSLPFVCNEKDALKMKKIFIKQQEEQVYEDPWEHKHVPFPTDEAQKGQIQEMQEDSQRHLQPSIQKDVTSNSVKADGSLTRSLKNRTSYEEIWTNKRISTTQKNKARKVDTRKRNELLYEESLVSKKNHQDSIKKERTETKKTTADTKSNKNALYDDPLKRKVLPPAKNKTRSEELENINKIYDQPWERKHFPKIPFNEDEILKMNIDSNFIKERTYEETWV